MERKIKGYKSLHKKNKKFKIPLQELKYKILDFFVDKNGNKVLRKDIVKDKNFKRAIGMLPTTELSENTFQSWCRRLYKYEPVGYIKNELIYKYHTEVTGRIDKNIPFEEWKSSIIDIVYFSNEIKKVIGWDDRKRVLAILKYNDNNFDIELYKNTKLEDLQFILDMKLSKREQDEIEKVLNEMIVNGDLKLVDYLV